MTNGKIIMITKPKGALIVAYKIANVKKQAKSKTPNKTYTKVFLLVSKSINRNIAK